MTIKTLKNVGDTVYTFLDNTLTIVGGKVDMINTESRSNGTTVETVVRYHVKTETNMVFKDEKDIYASAEEILAVIKTNSNLV